MGDESTELFKAGAEGVAAGATGAFLDALAGPLVESNDVLRDRIRVIRARKQVKMMAQTHDWLAEQGIEPQVVNWKVLFPLLDFASLEDEGDEPMIDRWAALLANAAAGPIGATVLPSFPHILAELSPEEAAILDDIYRPSDPDHAPQAYQLHPNILEARRRTDQMFDTRCFNLDRLSLVDTHWENYQVPGADPPEFIRRAHFVEGTGLGLSFVLACKPPRT